VPSTLSTRLPLDQLVETHAKHPGDKLENTKVLPVSTVAKIGRDWLRSFRGRPASAIIFLPERRRKTFLVLMTSNFAGEGFARHDSREDAPIPMNTLECVHLGIGPLRLGCGGRAEHNQELRMLKRGSNLFTKVIGGSKFLPITEDRS
jgi:hypothetical protein